MPAARHVPGPPRVIYLANHGVVALDTSQVPVLQITETANKVSRVLATAGLPRGTVPPAAPHAAKRPRAPGFRSPIR